MKEILLSQAHFYSVWLLQQHQPIPISCCTTHLPGCREDEQHMGKPGEMHASAHVNLSLLRQVGWLK